MQLAVGTTFGPWKGSESLNPVIAKSRVRHWSMVAHVKLFNSLAWLRVTCPWPCLCLLLSLSICLCLRLSVCRFVSTGENSSTRQKSVVCWWRHLLQLPDTLLRRYVQLYTQISAACWCNWTRSSATAKKTVRQLCTGPTLANSGPVPTTHQSQPPLPSPSPPSLPLSSISLPLSSLLLPLFPSSPRREAAPLKPASGSGGAL